MSKSISGHRIAPRLHLRYPDNPDSWELCDGKNCDHNRSDAEGRGFLTRVLFTTAAVLVAAALVQGVTGGEPSLLWAAPPLVLILSAIVASGTDRSFRE
jgi:hypothetical protein